MGNKAEALRILDAAYKARPDAEIAAHLGEVLWSLGQRDRAQAHLEGRPAAQQRERHPAGNAQAPARQAMSRARRRWARWLLALRRRCCWPAAPAPPTAAGPRRRATRALERPPGAAGRGQASASRFRPPSSSRAAPQRRRAGAVQPAGRHPGRAGLGARARPRCARNGQTREFDSVDALVAHATGAAIPVAALFDWLRGIDTPVPGWQADLSQLAAGPAARPARSSRRRRPTCGSCWTAS